MKKHKIKVVVYIGQTVNLVDGGTAVIVGMQGSKVLARQGDGNLIEIQGSLLEARKRPETLKQWKKKHPEKETVNFESELLAKLAIPAS